MNAPQRPIPLIAAPPAASDALLARRNYVAYLLEGIFFAVGLAFVDVQTLLPPILDSLGGPTWLVSLAPVLGQMALPLPVLLTLPLVSRLRRYVPYVAATKLLQCSPFLFAGLVLLAEPDRPLLAVTAVALAPVLSGIGSGLGAVAWANLMIVTIPPRRRTSLLALRQAIPAGLAVGVGVLVAAILNWSPGPRGYGLLHVLGFVALAAAMASYLIARDPAEPAAAEDGNAGLLSCIGRMLRVMVHDRRFALYTLSRFFQAGMYVLIPFLAIHAQHVLVKPQSYLGQLLIFQTVGAVAGNLLAGWLGDRAGAKLPTVIGTLAFVALSAWSSLAGSELAFAAIFFLLGFAFWSGFVGSLSLGLELAPLHSRTLYVALVNLVNLPSMLLASWAAGFLWELDCGLMPLAGASAASMLVSLVLLIMIREPRVNAAKEVV
jgi:MFS family permease